MPNLSTIVPFGHRNIIWSDGWLYSQDTNGQWYRCKPAVTLTAKQRAKLLKRLRQNAKRPAQSVAAERSR